MKYVMKSGMLYDGDQKKALARVKREFAGSERKILSADGAPVLRTEIRRPDNQAGTSGNTGDGVRSVEYILEDMAGCVCAAAQPDYAEGEEPERTGWPPYRMPKVDHAHLRMDGREYNLAMKGGSGYLLSERSGKEVLRILHRGITGGWDIDAADKLRPETICGLFVFCRYMERENEIVIV